MKSISLLLLLLLLQGFSPVGRSSDSPCLSTEERKLYELIMDYRRSKGLQSIPLSGRLTMVAQAHARDLNEHYKFDPNNKCNPHSWSSHGNWTPCCYTSDHKAAECMWNKPREIAGYESNGYEIAYYSSGRATAEEGLTGWKGSPGHNPVIINEGTWSKVTWRAIGIGIHGNYGVVWFGDIEDDQGAEDCGE